MMGWKSAGERAYRRNHWGIAHGRVLQLHDPDLPPDLVEMGILEELDVEGLGVVTFPEGSYAGLCHDPGPAQKMYLITEDGARRWARRELWDSSDALPLQVAQEMAGGRQVRYPHRCPGLPVTVLGEALNVVYYTVKGGDAEEREGVSYKHELGEDGGVPPLLCVDSHGRLWLAGGSYSVPSPGITK